MRKNKFSTRVIAEVAIFAAIAFVLDYLQGSIAKISMPVLANGGSIGIAMLPVIMISYRRGLIPGILCGLILSLIQMLGGVYAVTGSSLDGSFLQTVGPFIQVMLDYVLAYTVCGFAGVFATKYKKSTTLNQKILWVSLGSVLAGTLKYICHILSGLLFFPGEIWGISGAGYSFIYNGIYSIPNIIIVTILMVVLVRYYPTFIEDTNSKKEVQE